MRQIFILLLTGTLLAGCAAYSDNKKQTTLGETTLLYEKAIRWGDFAAARRFQHKNAGSPQATVNPGKFKVTLYRQLGSQPLADDNEVMITVKIDYYHSDTLKIYTLMDEQVWKYDREGNAWHIITPLPAFR